MMREPSMNIVLFTKNRWLRFAMHQGHASSLPSWLEFHPFSASRQFPSLFLTLSLFLKHFPRYGNALGPKSPIAPC